MQTEYTSFLPMKFKHKSCLFIPYLVSRNHIHGKYVKKLCTYCVDKENLPILDFYGHGVWQRHLSLEVHIDWVNIVEPWFVSQDELSPLTEQTLYTCRCMETQLCITQAICNTPTLYCLLCTHTHYHPYTHARNHKMAAQSLELVHKGRTLMEKVTERVGNWLSL